jgi:hypothetical protein
VCMEVVGWGGVGSVGGFGVSEVEQGGW